MRAESVRMMSDTAGKTTGNNSQDFSRLLEESSGFERENLTGRVVRGTVVRVEKENVFISIGLRSEGIVPLREFTDEEGGDCKVSEGQEVDVLVKSVRRGIPRISKAEADGLRHIKRLGDLFNEETPVRTKAVKRIKGGLECVVEGNITGAFMPASESGIRGGRNSADKLVGETFDSLIIELDGKRVVLSRKRILERSRAERVAEFVSQVEVGTEVRGVVSKIIPSGAFVDLSDGSGVVEGFIPVGEVAWRHIKTPSDVLSPGQEIPVQIIRIENNGDRIGLSYKQTQPTPWEEFAATTPQNSKVKGKISNVNEVGVFIEVARGVVGLLHPDNISWKEKVDPVEVYGDRKGEEIEVVVLRCDTEKKKVSLGVKQLQKDPWKTAVKKLKKGETVLTGTVKKETRGGFVLDLEDDMEGFIRFADMGDSDRDADKKAGDEITGVVKNVDDHARVVTLSAVMLSRKNEREMLKEFTSRHGETDSPKLGDLMSGGTGNDDPQK